MRDRPFPAARDAVPSPWFRCNSIVTARSLAPVNFWQQALRCALSPMFAHAITAAENAQRGSVVQDAIQKTC